MSEQEFVLVTMLAAAAVMLLAFFAAMVGLGIAMSATDDATERWKR